MEELVYILKIILYIAFIIMAILLTKSKVDKVTAWEYADKCKTYSDREYDAEALKENKQKYLCEKFFGGE